MHPHLFHFLGHGQLLSLQRRDSTSTEIRKTQLVDPISFQPRKSLLYIIFIITTTTSSSSLSPPFSLLTQHIPSSRLDLTSPRFDLFNTQFIVTRIRIFSEEMSSSSKSKSKDKKAGKEQKASSKASPTVNATSGVHTSAYNPILGTFHTLDTASTAPALHVNGRFRNIDDSDDHSGSNNESGGYDSASNNDNRSVESDEQKQATTKQEVIPGADNDKREKVRQKNEKKHQRQKEKRAQELHERCTGFLMLRKLEALAQQLVGMGFSVDRATMALMLNGGKLEEAVAWLFEVGEEADKQPDQSLDTGSNLKIDISQELSRIAELEFKFKCSKQDVERALVACEGDLDKAEETLKSQKQEPPTAMLKLEEASDPPSLSNGKKTSAINQTSIRPQLKPTGATNALQQRRDERDFNYTKATVTVGPAVKTLTKNVQQVTRIQQQKVELARLQQLGTPTSEKRLLSGGSITSGSHPLSAPSQMSPPVLTESHYGQESGEYKPMQSGIVREPVVMMQRPQSVNARNSPVSNISSSPAGIAPGWYPSSPEIMKPNMLPPHIPSTRSPSPNNVSSNHFYHQQIYPQCQQLNHGGGSLNAPTTTRGDSSFNRAGTSPTTTRGDSSFNRAGTSPPVAATSLGLFSGLGSTYSSGANSPVDWSSYGSMSCDYENIDWSINRSLRPSKSNEMWLGLDIFQKSNSRLHDSNDLNLMSVKPGMRPTSPHGNGVSVMGLQDGLSGMPDTSPAVSYDWTSPFEVLQETIPSHDTPGYLFISR
ncbi:hypothetical protein AKJ16_DCAP12584 [Drosera capensis]